MLYLGALKHINGDTYQAYHIITDHTKSHMTTKQLEEKGILIDAKLPPNVRKVFVNIATQELSFEYRNPESEAAKTAAIIQENMTKTAEWMALGDVAKK